MQWTGGAKKNKEVQIQPSIVLNNCKSTRTDQIYETPMSSIKRSAISKFHEYYREAAKHYYARSVKQN